LGSPSLLACTFITGGLDAESYVKIVKTKLLSKASEHFGEGEWLLQADGDPAHTAKHTVEELEHLGESRGFSLLSWPPHSPDMNPVENVFSQLKNLVSEAPLSQNTKELQALIESNIELLNAEENHFYFQHLDSMYDRCFQDQGARLSDALNRVFRSFTAGRHGAKIFSNFPHPCQPLSASLAASA
jgi:hypothetical protein